MLTLLSFTPRARRCAARATTVVLALLAACGRSDSLSGPVATEPPPHYPIIFVHGLDSNGSILTTMIARFRADGWTDRELVNWTYDYAQSNAVTAQQLGAKIDSVLASTGAHHVDIVSHSMATLAARYYVRNLLPGSDTATRIDAIVSLAGTNHGAALAIFCGAISCVEIRPGSVFLDALNAGDETPGTPRCATWWSPCDEAVSPRTSTILAGAENTQTACVTHNELHEDATVYTQLRDFVKPTRYGR